MSGKDRQTWQAMLDADPRLRLAWNEFRTILARMEHTNGTDIENLSRATDRLLAEFGDEQPHH